MGDVDKAISDSIRQGMMGRPKFVELVGNYSQGDVLAYLTNDCCHPDKISVTIENDMVTLTGFDEFGDEYWSIGWRIQF